MPRMRGRDYKRQQDDSVILVLVKAAEELTLDADPAAAAADGAIAAAGAADTDQQQPQSQQQQQQQKGKTAAGKGTGKKPAIGGDYDGPDAADTIISGIPKLPPNTVAPPSPAREQQWGRQGGEGSAGVQQQGFGGMMQQGSGMMGQQQQQLALMHRRSSNASAGLAGLADEEEAGGQPINNSQPGEGTCFMLGQGQGKVNVVGWERE